MPINPTPLRLLAIVELGGYPNFQALYQDCGFEVNMVNHLRSALQVLKVFKPHVIVAEFIYSPIYGSRISNFESLIASIQKTVADAKIVALLEKAHLPYLQQLEDRMTVHEKIYFPIEETELRHALRRVSVSLL